MPAPKKKETIPKRWNGWRKLVSQIDNNELEIDELSRKDKGGK